MYRFPTRHPPLQRLLIYARVPEVGLVKTRLARDLGDERTLEVYHSMLSDLLSTVGVSNDELQVEVLWTGSEAVRGEQLKRHFPGLSISMQTGNDLGQRLSIAFAERLFFHGTEKVIAIGVDDPSLTRRGVELAFRLLDSCEWTLGPASDGGYYLIGCRARAFRSEVFEDIEWGSSTVLTLTTAKIRAGGGTLALLPEHRDIDELSDLKALSESIPEHARLLRQTIEGWGWIT
ncbi:MAG TPA: TIGR04282 family arsenosugar biosynthesis glycosyltransferase [Thermoanaerobaculia bacterium]|nr:TIGR04282 family arsenosugar biosynthesis glycosyltransferase [Thermoanaerobaculia bacterium]